LTTVATLRAPRRRCGDPLRALVEDTPEDSALGDPGGLEPRSQCRYRARNLAAWDSHLAADSFLVRLRTPDCDQHALRGLLDVRDVERHELGAPEGTREAKQDDGAVSERTKRCPRCAHGDDHVRGRGSLAYGGGTDRAPNAGKDRVDLLVTEAGTTDDPRSKTLDAIQRAFEKAGIVFLEPGDLRDGGAGVRLKKAERRR